MNSRYARSQPAALPIEDRLRRGLRAGFELGAALFIGGVWVVLVLQGDPTHEVASAH